MRMNRACLALALSGNCALASAAGLASPVLRAAGGTSVDEALRAVAQAAAAARESASAASAAAERNAVLERTVAALRDEVQAQREQAAQMREQLEQSGGQGSAPWALAGLTLALAALCAWLVARLLALRRLQAQAWRVAGDGVLGHGRGTGDDGGDSPTRPPTSAMAFVHSEFEPSGSGAPLTRSTRAWPAPAPADLAPPRAAPVAANALWTAGPARGETPPPPAGSVAAQAASAGVLRPAIVPAREPASERTEVLAPPTAPGEAAARDVSIDELLDLEQQADFFVVLGQDDAAIDLLVEHLRHTGGGSPLPYLKLLEIHRRRGEQSDYERMRARFNHRFNAYAPDWEVDLESGRTLQDYPGVLPRLQQVWSRPLDAMAELEALMFRKARGELFDLPAYREVMFLYTLSRDLLDRESADTGQVDLLLPLFQGAEAPHAASATSGDTDPDSLQAAFDFEDRPTAPVDLDLSFDGERSPSIFDTLDTQPGRRR